MTGRSSINVGCSSKNRCSTAVVIAVGERLPDSHCRKVGSLAGTTAVARARTASAWLRPFAYDAMTYISRTVA